jgi:spore coat polysaccharide biosynthesis protein SpsF
MNSKRLPGKVLLPLNGHTVLNEVIARCWKIPGIDLVAVTTPDRDVFDVVGKQCLADLAPKNKEDDVLWRYYAAARGTEADIIVRITADCPLISPELCGAVVEELKSQHADYASNIVPRTFPKGLDCEAFTMNALVAANISAETPYEREHVTAWMRLNPLMKHAHVTSRWPIEGRLTLDTEDDYRTICAYFGHEPYQHLRAA